MRKFERFKEYVLGIAKESNACADEYRRAAKAESMADLCKVVTDNFHWSCENGLLTGKVIEEYGLSEFGIRYNVNADGGWLLVDGSATVEAWGSATVRASGSATVRASGSATVRARDSATVEAWGSATVRASGSATVRASGSAYVHAPYVAIECQLSEHAILRYAGTIKSATSEMKLR